jgi:hypothetical protein
MSGAGPEKTWWRNLVGGAPVQVLLRRHPYDGKARVATYDDNPATVAEGVHRYMTRFPRLAKRFGLAHGDEAAYEAFARDTVIVRIDLDR